LFQFHFNCADSVMRARNASTENQVTAEFGQDALVSHYAHHDHSISPPAVLFVFTF